MGAMLGSEFWSTLSSKGSTMKRQYSKSELPRHWNRVAARLSAIPGLGQFYKGHLAEALFLMFLNLGVLLWLGTILCLFYATGAILEAWGVSIDWLVFLFNPITFYVGLMPALLYWVWVAIDAFDEPDLRHGIPADADEPNCVNERWQAKNR
jgi:hypothetical protein